MRGPTSNFTAANNSTTPADDHKTNQKNVSKAIKKAAEEAIANAIFNTARKNLREVEDDDDDRGALNLYLIVRCSFGEMVRACVVDTVELVRDADL